MPSPSQPEPSGRHSVLVLGGGPDAEREVSIRSSTAIAEALRSTGRYRVHLEIIERITLEQLRALPGGVIVPYLHGPWGEGGPLQDLLEADGRPFVGSGSRAARVAMDKVATKAVALGLQILTPPWFILNPSDPVSPLGYPVVVKPVHEGSTIGLHVCNSAAELEQACRVIRDEQRRGLCRAYLVEPRIGNGWGRELTVGVVDDRALPVIEIVPRSGLYDYEAKYTRNDTQYLVNPTLPSGVGERIASASVRLSKALGCRHIARVDFMLDPTTGTPWLLEINTTPGMTDHSLVPKAAAAAGLSMPDLCASLVEMALRGASSART
jgi:D-alanine-D-alanine ligase